MLTHSPRIATDGLILCLDAANRQSYPGSGNVWRDLAGSNNGTLINGPTFNSANVGSIVFDGVNDYVQIANNNSINSPLSSDFSYDVWVYLRLGGNVFGKIFSKGWSGSPQNCLQLGVNITGAIKYCNIELMISGSAVYPGGFIIEPFKWVNIMVIRNLTALSIYSNTVLKSTATISANLSNSNPLRIGVEAQPININEYTQQNIGSFKMYNRALTPTEIQQNYNALKGRYNL